MFSRAKFTLNKWEKFCDSPYQEAVITTKTNYYKSSFFGEFTHLSPSCVFATFADALGNERIWPFQDCRHIIIFSCSHKKATDTYFSKLIKRELLAENPSKSHDFFTAQGTLTTSLLIKLLQRKWNSSRDYVELLLASIGKSNLQLVALIKKLASEQVWLWRLSSFIFWRPQQPRLPSQVA